MNLTPREMLNQVGGPADRLETRWMQLLESPDLSAPRLVDFDAVLSALVENAERTLAETLAWTAIETVAAKRGPAEALHLAGRFLLAVGDGDELRRETADLYRQVYGDREDLEALLDEAGLPGGRPVRRAVRTLDVCLNVQEGTFLAARHSDAAARIDRIDRPAWRFTVYTGEDTRELGAVHLADEYEPANEDDFRVMRCFNRDALKQRLQRVPGDVVIALCRLYDNKIDSDRLERILVPDVIAPTDWKKWWTKARTALKHDAGVHIEGRSPYEITVLDNTVSFESRMLAEFERHRDPVAKLAAVEQYLRDCKARNETPSASALNRCHEHFVDRARKLEKAGGSRALVPWLIARRIGEAAGIEGAGDGVVEWMRDRDDLPQVLRKIDDANLLELACNSLIEARPHDWQDLILDLLPDLPMGLCDNLTAKLLSAGRPLSDLHTVVQTVLASPAEHFEALLWLWDGPTEPQLVADITPSTLLARILRALEQARLGENVSKEQARQIASRARTVLAARNYQRLESCFDTIDAAMAAALRTQISKLDNLGRAVREDVLTRLRRRFPLADPKRDIQPWAREDRIYVTRAGLAKKQAEVNHHVNVKMKENARAIGAAAEHGDLSENSEYKFALEERDLLRGMLAQMNAELAAAVIMTPDQVPADHVGVGTRAVFRRVDDGQRYEVSLLGPWDADPECKTLNYKSPLAQRLMGKRVGDLVEFEHADVVGRFELIELHNALAARAESPT